MCDNISPEEQQKDELVALKEIFQGDVVDNREKNAWKIWKPLDLLIKLVPLYNSNAGVHCSATLRFKCCARYPAKKPEISIHSLTGVSSDNAKILLSELNELAEKKCGEVMIYDLATHTQNFLHNHNYPSLSFYDDMLKQKKEEEKQKQIKKKTEDDKKREEYKEGMLKRERMLRDSERRQSYSISHTPNDESNNETVKESVIFANPRESPNKTFVRHQANVTCNCTVKSGEVLKIGQWNNRKVYMSSCIGHATTGATTLLAIENECGYRYVVKKWTLPSTTDYKTRSRQLNAFYEEFNLLKKFQHPSLLPYVVMETPKDSIKEGKMTIYLLREFVLGCTLHHLLNLRANSRVKNGKSDALKLLRSVSSEVLGALKELHSKDILHRDVRSENVFLDVSGGVKLVGVGLDSRLMEMVDGKYYSDRQTKEQDIYYASQMLMSIVGVENRNINDIPRDLPPEAREFLLRLSEDELSVEQLASHRFLSDPPSLHLATTKEAYSSEEEGDLGAEIQKEEITSDPNSRVNSNFDVIQRIGKGGFGEVWKVKNKLDSSFYALKRVKLNTRRAKDTKRITREVQLLSSLNHENVVRYYNAWIESVTDQMEEESSEPTGSVRREDSLKDENSKLKFQCHIEWSMLPGANVDEDDAYTWYSKKEDEEEEESDSIQFKDSNADNKSLTQSLEKVTLETDNTRTRSPPLNHYLYIQMQLCENYTIRKAINDGLCQDESRAWRLFREIVEGLRHIHEKKMIHRDLNPANIFLDSSDHVKIGDFGLATTISLSVNDKVPESGEMEGSLTRGFGTPSYIAPELLQSASGNVMYNQKVDLYSLGITLLEMFYQFKTGSERIKVIEKIRTPDIIIPEDFNKKENASQIALLKWLLNHDPYARPTCKELLNSPHMPLSSRFEFEAHGFVSYVFQHQRVESSHYKKLISACINQKLSPTEDRTYNKDTARSPHVFTVRDILAEVYKSHGASEFATQLLVPKAPGWEQNPKAVVVMAADGAVCHLPHDLRLPFARHVAFSKVKYMRRYATEHVYRQKAQRFHPREIVESVFDIVTPKTDSLWSDAELLVVASRAAAACSLKVTLQLNHRQLLSVALLSCGVPEDKHADVYPVLVDMSFGRITKMQLETHLTSLCISYVVVNNVLLLMETDVNVSDMKEMVTNLIKDPKLTQIATDACAQIEELQRNAKALGCDVPMRVAPFLAYNAEQHCGVFWQMYVVCSSSRRRYGSLIGVGGRYNALVQQYWKQMLDTEEPLNTTSVGLTMYLEKIVTVLGKGVVDLAPPLQIVDPAIVCVCVSDAAGTGREYAAANRRARLAQQLWDSRIRCITWPAPDTEMDRNDVHNLTGAHVAIDGDVTMHLTYRITSARVSNEKMPYIDVLDFVKQLLNSNARNSDGSNSSNWSDSEKPPNIYITFVTGGDRLNKPKKFYETQIIGTTTYQLMRAGLRVSPGVRVHVIALLCSSDDVRALAARLDAPLDERDIEQAFDALDKRLDKNRELWEEARKELTNEARSNRNNKNRNETHLYALYSIPDIVLRFIT